MKSRRKQWNILLTCNVCLERMISCLGTSSNTRSCTCSAQLDTSPKLWSPQMSRACSQTCSCEPVHWLALCRSQWTLRQSWAASCRQAGHMFVHHSCSVPKFGWILKYSFFLVFHFKMVPMDCCNARLFLASFFRNPLWFVYSSETSGIVPLAVIVKCTR